MHGTPAFLGSMAYGALPCNVVQHLDWWKLIRVCGPRLQIEGWGNEASAKRNAPPSKPHAHELSVCSHMALVAMV